MMTAAILLQLYTRCMPGRLVSRLLDPIRVLTGKSSAPLIATSGHAQRPLGQPGDLHRSPDQVQAPSDQDLYVALRISLRGLTNDVDGVLDTGYDVDSVSGEGGYQL